MTKTQIAKGLFVISGSLVWAFVALGLWLYDTAPTTIALLFAGVFALLALLAWRFFPWFGHAPLPAGMEDSPLGWSRASRVGRVAQNPAIPCTSGGQPVATGCRSSPQRRRHQLLFDLHESTAR